MSVLVQAFSVIVKNETLEYLYPEGVDGFRKSCPNRTFCTDGHISRISFMVIQDVMAFIAHLEELGFIFTLRGESRDIAVIDAPKGFSPPCNWLSLDKDEDGLMFCWLSSKEPGDIVIPEGWNRNIQLTWMDAEEFRKKYRYLRTENNCVDVYEDNETGKIQFIGRTSANHDIEEYDKKLTNIGKRLVTLDKEAEKSRIENQGKLEESLEAELQDICRQVRELKCNEGPLESFSCYILGLSLRILQHWKEAEREFRHLVRLKPDDVCGWLELTWCLSLLKRYEEAEWAAQHAIDISPGSAAAWGNMAFTLISLKKREDAREAIEKALVFDPDDRKNRYIFENFDKLWQRADQASKD